MLHPVQGANSVQCLDTRQDTNMLGRVTALMAWRDAACPPTQLLRTNVPHCPLPCLSAPTGAPQVLTTHDLPDYVEGLGPAPGLVLQPPVQALRPGQLVLHHGWRHHPNGQALWYCPPRRP